MSALIEQKRSDPLPKQVMPSATLRNTAESVMPRRLPLYTILAATLLIVFWMYATYQLYQDFIVATKQPGGGWERAQAIYSGITSVGFAAIGVLLGTQVQQVNVAAARSDADKARLGEAKAKGAIKDVLPMLPPDDRGGGSRDAAVTAESALAAVRQRLQTALAE